MPGSVITVARRPRPRAMDTLGALAILRGLAVTSRHFFRNLWGFIRGRPTIFTIHYPEETQRFHPAYRGMPVLVEMPNGKERCVACGLCEWACPVDCITIYPAETHDEVQRYPRVFDIDMSRCMFCGLCEDACPTPCLELTQDFELALYGRREMKWDRQKLEQGNQPVLYTR
jgi:NADH-quinone oxidoreductase subunit I